jgi:Tol biopolymer transport system component
MVQDPTFGEPLHERGIASTAVVDPNRGISTDGGTDPSWSSDGRELFYLHGDRLMAVPIHTAPAPNVTPRLQFEGRYERSDSGRNYDVAPDGKRFVMIRSDDPSRRRESTSYQLA